MAAGPDEVHAVVKQILSETSTSHNIAADTTSPELILPRIEEGLHNLAPLGARVPLNEAAVRRTGKVCLVL